jgi:hypothetical protein
MRARVRSRTAGLVRTPVVRLRCAISKTRRAMLHGARQHPHPIGQQRAVGRIVNVGLDDGRVHAQSPASDEPLRPPQRHQPGQHILEDGLVEERGQPEQRLGVRHALPVDPAEGSVDQVATHLAFTLVEAPVVEVLEDQQPQHDGRRCPQPAPSATLRVAAPQGVGDAIDEHLVIEQRIDPAERGVPELVRIGQEHFDQAALRVRPPHHGASGEAGRPQSPHRVSRVAARAATSRRSLTIACALGGRQANCDVWTRGDARTPHKHRINPVCFAPGSS